MRDLAVLLLHLLATVARLAGPGGRENGRPICVPPMVFLKYIDINILDVNDKMPKMLKGDAA